MWTIRHYVSGNGSHPFRDWYEALDDNIRAAFDARLRSLRQQPRNGWSMPHFRMLHGPCAGLGEIRFKVGRVQYRPLGFFGPGANEFTLLVGAIEKGGALRPKNACVVALRYVSELERNQMAAHSSQPKAPQRGLGGGYVDDWDA